MEKEKNEFTLSELNKMTAKCIAEAIKNGDYTWEFTIDEPVVGDDGYVPVNLTIGNEKMRVLVNYHNVCWMSEISQTVKNIVYDYKVEKKFAEEVFAKLNG